MGRWKLVSVGHPIGIGAVTIRRGDFVVGDKDGVLVIPQEITLQVLEKSEEVVGTEISFARLSYRVFTLSKLTGSTAVPEASGSAALVVGVRLAVPSSFSSRGPKQEGTASRTPTTRRCPVTIVKNWLLQQTIAG